MRPPFVRLLLLSFLSLSFASAAFAQNCGQRDTIIYLGNNSGSIELEISDYFNDDLSDPAQGLCGIEIGFVHQFVENFEVSISSPAGQSINLIGPNGDDALDFTIGTEWNITFIPCLEMAQPDSAFAAQWDNEQPENWVNFGDYTGSYYPYQGCLEDFNSGPVNGTWTFDINNDPSSNPGAITYLRLIFCDSRGVECCFAQGGQWLNDDILTCEGSDTLLIDPQIAFPVGVADTLEYGYAYLFDFDGIYQGLDSVIDLRNAAPGEYNICGFSYRRSEIDSLPLPDGSLTMDSIRNNLYGLEPWMCAEFTPECLEITILAPPDTTRLTERICEGDSILVGTMPFRDNGFYTVDLLSQAGCDSIVTLDLFVLELQEIFLTEIICPGDSFVVGNMAYFETGIYRDTLPTVELGCDSIVQLDLTMLSDLLVELDSVICIGDQIQIGDSILQDAGSYQILLESVRGCDSLVQVELTVLDPMAQINGAEQLNCQSLSIILDGESFGSPGTFSYSWLNESNMNIGSSPTLLVEQDGNYIFELTQTFNGVSCQDRDTVTISSNFSVPIADAGPDTSITCRNNIIEIGGTNTSTGTNYVYEWQTTNGQLMPPLDQPTLLADSAGDYQLIVRDTFSFCADTAIVNLSNQTDSPPVLMEAGFILNCLLLQDTLDGRASLTSTEITATWSGPCISNELAPAWVIADCPGWYILEVENTATGCIALDSVFIDQDINPAMANIAIPDTLTCALPQVNLDASASDPDGLLTFDWDGPGQPLADQASVDVDLSGLYTLIVSRTDNFCRDTATVMVEQDTLPPMADAGPDLDLNCNLFSAFAGGPNTETGPAISYQWCSLSDPIDGAVEDSLLVTTAGMYILKVTNNNNGCSNSDTVMITDDFQLPELINAGPDAQLNCAGESVLLIPDSTNFSRPVDWEWDGPCFTSATDTWAVTTDCPGLYTLTVTNQDNGCSAFDTVRVTASSNFSQAILADEELSLDCDTGTATLLTGGSIGSVFQWFRDDVPISLPNNDPSVNIAGLYTLVASDANMICSDTAQTIVVIDCPLMALITTPDTLTCLRSSVLLSAANSITTGSVTYNWSGPNVNCFLNDQDQAEVNVVCDGNYQLIIEQPLFGLRDTAYVEVIIDTVAPVMSAGENLQITCSTPSPTLMGTVMGNPDDFSYCWTTFDGSDTLSFSADFSSGNPGSYFFIVKDNSNGCESRDIAQLSLNNAPIDIAFGSSIFPCQRDTFRLQAFVSPPSSDYIHQWTGPGIQADADSLDALINSLGEYFFTVTNPTNGCTATDSIAVTNQICVPCLELPSADTLNCLSESIVLSASFCAPCVGCELQWSDSSGPLAGQNSLDLAVNTAGQYTLTATDLMGFSSNVTSQVADLRIVPALELGEDRVLTCDSLNLSLQNLLPNNSSRLRYEWSLLDGTILPETDSVLVVSLSETYILTITDTLSWCQSADTIGITQNLELPIAEAGPNQQLTCESNIVLLDGSESTLAGASYQWTGPMGSCLAGATTTNPIASCEGLYTLTVTLDRNGCSAQDTVRVERNEGLPEIMPIPDTLLSCQQTMLTLTGNVPMEGDYSVSWCALDAMGVPVLSSCDTFLTYSLSEAGDYQFTVVNDATQCSNSYTVNVASDTIPPAADAGLTDTLRCGSLNVGLSGSVGNDATFSWSGPTGATITTPNILDPTVDQAGWYTLSAISNSNGCSAQDSVQIVLDENIPQLDAGSDTVLNCFNTTLQLNAIGSTNSGSTEWQWTTLTGTIDEINTPSPTVSDSAWYFVTLLDPVNTCSIVDSVYVGQDESLPVAVVEGIDTLTCALDTLMLDGSNSISSSGIGLDYTWRVINGQLFPDLSAAQVLTDRPGAYRLIVQDQGNGCLDTLDFDISANFVRPDLSLAVPDSLTCAVDSVLLQTIIPDNAAGFNFSWTNEIGQVISEDSTAYAYAPGRYFLLLEASSNGCTRLDSVDVFAAADLPTVNISPPLTISCSRPIVMLDGSQSVTGPNYLYQWSSPNGGSLLGNANSLLDSTQQAGTYILQITDTINGCQAQDSVQVVLLGNPISGTDLDLTPPPCQGGVTGAELGSISVNGVQGGTPPYTYSLDGSPFDVFSFFEDLPTGTYQLSILDSEGCSWEESIPLLPAVEITLDLGPDLQLELGDSIQLDPQVSQPVDSFLWQSFGLFSPTESLKPIITPIETQFILLTVYDANGCAATDTLRVFVTDDLDVFIPTAFSPNGDGENDLFTIFAGPEITEVVSLRVFSRWGNMVWERQNFLPNDPSQGWDGTLWGQNLNSAVFVYQLEVMIEGRGLQVLTGEVLLMR